MTGYDCFWLSRCSKLKYQYHYKHLCNQLYMHHSLLWHNSELVAEIKIRYIYKNFTIPAINQVEWSPVQPMHNSFNLLKHFWTDSRTSGSIPIQWKSPKPRSKFACLGSWSSCWILIFEGFLNHDSDDIFQTNKCTSIIRQIGLENLSSCWKMYPWQLTILHWTILGLTFR